MGKGKDAEAFRSRIVGDGEESPDQLLANPLNWRVHPKEQVDALEGLLKQVGWVQRVIVNRRTGYVVDGHARVALALRRGEPTLPVVYVDLSEDEERLVLAAIDPIGGMAGQDDDLLAQVLDGLQADDAGLQALLDSLRPPPAETVGLTDPDEAPPVPVEPVTKPGDVWLLGRHRIVCGDSTAQSDVDKALAGVKPHLMVTDPPYGVKYDPNWRKDAGVSSAGAATGVVLNDDRADWREAWALFPGSVAYVWHGGLHAGTVAESLAACKFAIRAQIVWVKTRPALSRGHYHWQHEPALYGVRDGEEDQWRFIPEHEVAGYAVKDGATAHWQGGRKQSTVWFIEHIKSDTGHGTQKPVECMKRPIENNSSPGQAVYEPFSGSGTTIIAAEMTGRCCHALELSPAYVDVAVKRWQTFTGKQAALEGDGRTFDEIAAERTPAEA